MSKIIIPRDDELYSSACDRILADWYKSGAREESEEVREAKALFERWQNGMRRIMMPRAYKALVNNQRDKS